jgi:hypothetical protein
VRSRARLLVLLALVLAVLPMAVSAGEPIDLDLWHEDLVDALGAEPEEKTDQPPAFGLYPTLGGSIGPPNWASAQGHAYLSFTDGKSFSIYAGYGVEWGSEADSSVITVGWGGVRSIPVASRQTGFHGKFLRYRRWDDEDHGIHHGLSFGTESGVGFGALAFEFGAARSDRNHWLIVAQIQLKIAAPIRIPLTREKALPDENGSALKMRSQESEMRN